jgi:hypothetical protein
VLKDGGVLRQGVLAFAGRELEPGGNVSIPSVELEKEGSGRISPLDAEPDVE